MSMTNIKKRSMLELVDEAQRKCSLDLNSGVRPARWFKDELAGNYSFLNNKEEMVQFITQNCVKLIGSGATVFLDGGDENRRVMHGKDLLDLVSKTMAYLCCSRLIDENCVLDMSRLMRKVEFSTLINDALDYSRSTASLENFSGCDILLVSFAKSSMINNLIASKDSEMTLSKKEKISSFLDQLFLKRKASRGITVISMSGTLNGNITNCDAFGSILGDMMTVLQGKPNFFGEKFLQENRCCRIAFPQSREAAQNMGLKSFPSEKTFFLLLGKTFTEEEKEAFRLKLSGFFKSEDSERRLESFFYNMASDLEKFRVANPRGERLMNYDLARPIIDLLKKNPDVLFQMRSDL